MENTTSISVKGVPKTLWDRVRIEAIRRKVSVAELVTEALKLITTGGGK